MSSRIFIDDPHARPRYWQSPKLFFVFSFILIFGLAKTTAAARVPVITSATAASAAVGRAFSYQITATNAPTSYGASALPTGLAINTSTGMISGTPAVAETSGVTLSASNRRGRGTATLTITINPAPPVITSPVTASGTVGNSFSYLITATNVPVSFSATGLPAGLIVNSGTGLISGTPVSAGTSAVTLGATNSGGSGSSTLTLTITQFSPGAALSPNSLSFASQLTNTSSTPQTITLNNAGNATLTLSSIALTGANPGDFVQTNNCGSNVGAGANCTIAVTFKPLATGLRTAVLLATDNATGSPQSVSLSGTGTSTVGTASLSPPSLAFGNCPALTMCSPQSVTLNNSGSTTVNLTSIAFTGTNPSDFTQNNTCGAAVASGASCNIVISFTPAAVGAQTAWLSVTDNASGSPQSAALSGTGTHDVILTWNASASTGIAGYNVYRGASSGAESPTPLNSTPISATTYTDANVAAGGKYYYVVTTVFSLGSAQSAGSNEAMATVPSP